MRTTTLGLTLLILGILSVRTPGQLPRRFQVTVGGATSSSDVDIAAAGDVDGDGVGDVLVGLPFEFVSGMLNAGRAEILSGRDGSVLHTFVGSAAGQHLGSGVASVGDVNGDGFADVAVGSPGSPSIGLPSTGCVEVFSGLDGSVLYTLTGAHLFDRFGKRLRGGADLDGDGIGDLLIGIPGANGPAGVEVGAAEVRSGADGSLLRSWSGTGAEDRFGDTLDFAGDVNADGVEDVVIGAMLSDVNGTNSGQVKVFSGLDGSLIYTFNGPTAQHELGASVAGAGDVNGDGHADILVGGTGLYAGMYFFTSYVLVLSGSDGTLLFSVTPTTANQGFGKQGAGAGDSNGDGFDDFLILDPSVSSTLDVPGVLVMSGRDNAPLAKFFEVAGVMSWGTPVAFRGLGDLDGDDLGDVGAVFFGPFPGFGGQYSLRVAVFSAAGRRIYGEGLNPLTQTLELDWDSGSPLADGALSCTGSLPNSPGLLVVSEGSDSTVFSGVPILVETFPSTSFGVPFTFDAAGELHVPLNLAVPSLEGTGIYLQAFGVDTSLPPAATASNGLNLLFTR
ncbi:MAG TPA: hypothetical protein ENK43_01370 [Planctomycetes bacterium]|nr:hypothetical protein [Planctomycetota bacterium]